MPSEGATPWLRSQGLGLLCGQATVLLLGAGTLVLAATREGASTEVQLDDLTVFFRQPSWVHAWLYGLFPVVALYAVNTVLCTWDSALSRWRRGGAGAAAWAPAVIHVAFLLALLAHGVGGFWNHDVGAVLVGGTPVALEGGRTLRLARLTRERTPSGKLAQVHAVVEVAGPGARRESVDVGYNHPLSWGLGSELLLLAEARPHAAVDLDWEGQRCLVEPPGGCRLGPLEVEVASVQARGAREVAVVRVSAPGQAEETFPLAVGGRRALRGGGELRFEGVRVEEAVLLRHRLAPGHPIALASALVLVLGLVLMGRRWMRPAAA